MAWTLSDDGIAPLSSSPRTIAIIGSGIGGMACGALFARFGHHVTVFERHPSLIGGHGRTLTFENLRFCMGPQYVWSFGPHDIGGRFLAYLGLTDSNPFVPMDEDCFERILIGGVDPDTNYVRADFRIPQGFE